MFRCPPHKTVNSIFFKSSTISGYVGSVNAPHAQRDPQANHRVLKQFSSPLQTPPAFIFSDFPFLDHQHRLILAITPDTITPLTSVTIEWRFQKTNTNCEKIPFARVSKRPPPFCPVLAALRIVQCTSTSQQMHLWQSTTVHPHQPNTKSPLSYTASAQVTACLHKQPSASSIRTLLCSRNGPVIPFE